MMAPHSTFIFGISSRKLPSFPRSFGYHPKCAAIYVVLGFFLNMRCCSSISCCHGAGSVSLRLRRSCVASSSHRSFFSSIGSQNGFGSAVCIRTGIFNSPAFFQIGSRRGSSTGTRLPFISFTDIPRFLKIFKPFAPFFTSCSNCFAAFSPQPSCPIPLKSTLANTIKRFG